jgi:hypothetical protein
MSAQIPTLNMNFVSMPRMASVHQFKINSPLGKVVPRSPGSATKVGDVASLGLDGEGGPVCISMSSNV